MMNHLSDKTRVLITEQKLQDILTSIFSQNHISYQIISENSSEITDEDFVVLFSHHQQIFSEFQPNIVLVDEHFSENPQNLIASIKGGGILIYPENNALLEEKANHSENFFRKITFDKAQYQISETVALFETELGNLPVQTTDDIVLTHLLGLKDLCQHIGIQEEDFYESLLNYKS